MQAIFPFITQQGKNIQHSTYQNTEPPTTLSISVTPSRLNADLVFPFLKSFEHLTARLFNCSRSQRETAQRGPNVAVGRHQGPAARGLHDDRARASRCLQRTRAPRAQRMRSQSVGRRVTAWPDSHLAVPPQRLHAGSLPVIASLYSR